jgi:hypothetical protein
LIEFSVMDEHVGHPQAPSQPRPGQASRPSNPWPLGKTDRLRAILDRAWDPDLISAFSRVPRATTTYPDPLLACLTDLRERYLHIQGLNGTLHFDETTPKLSVAESPLRSILEHLVEGALRDSPAERPFCHVGVADQDERHVTLYVRDNGRELPECTVESLRKIVRESTETAVPDRVYRLFLADNLVQWLGGHMWVGPTPNGAGSSVFLRLPRAQAT